MQKNKPHSSEVRAVELTEDSAGQNGAEGMARLLSFPATPRIHTEVLMPSAAILSVLQI